MPAIVHALDGTGINTGLQVKKPVRTPSAATSRATRRALFAMNPRSCAFSSVRY